MSKRVFVTNNWTAVAIANTTDLPDNQFMALQGGGATQVIQIAEIYMGGQAAASAALQMVLARDAVVSATGTLAANSSDVFFRSSATPLNPPPVAYNQTSSAAQPQRSASAYLLALGFNAFGGVVKWTVPTDEGPSSIGNTAPNGEISLSANFATASALMNSHIIYEVL